MLADKDRIFLNLYGKQDWRLEGAKNRGAWNMTREIIGQSPQWIVDRGRPVRI